MILRDRPLAGHADWVRPIPCTADAVRGSAEHADRRHRHPPPRSHLQNAHRALRRSVIDR